MLTEGDGGGGNSVVFEGLAGLDRTVVSGLIFA
jgi:hypothetical protein